MRCFCLILGLTSCFAFADSGSDSGCGPWLQSRINTQNRNFSSPDCSLRCITASTTPHTKHCPQVCLNYCSAFLPPQPTFPQYTTPLIAEEWTFVLTHPIQAAQVYRFGMKAHNICNQFFGSFNPEKESGIHNACSHFIWSALLYNQFGFWFSEYISFMHEQYPNQPLLQKKMDITNNHLGMNTAKKLIQAKQFTEINLIKSFYKQFKAGAVVTLEDHTTPIKH